MKFLYIALASSIVLAQQSKTPAQILQQASDCAKKCATSFTTIPCDVPTATKFVSCLGENSCPASDGNLVQDLNAYCHNNGMTNPPSTIPGDSTKLESGSSSNSSSGNNSSTGSAIPTSTAPPAQTVAPLAGATPTFSSGAVKSTALLGVVAFVALVI